MPTLQMPSTKRRAGFSDLKRSNPKLYHHWKTFIELCIDKHDYGFLIAETRQKRRANNKNKLNHWLDTSTPHKRRKAEAAAANIGQLSSLSLSKLESHCRGDQTYYYASNPWHRYALIMLDIDDKDGSAGDALDVFKYLRTVFRDIYGETSTFGKGYHGYLFVTYKDQSREDFKELLGRLAECLASRLKDNGFKSVIEIKGTPSLIGKWRSGKVYDTCGQLAKFPRLQGSFDSKPTEAPNFDQASAYGLAAPPHPTDGAVLELEIESFLRRPEFTFEQLVTIVESPSGSLPSDIDMDTESIDTRFVSISISEGRGSRRTAKEEADAVLGIASKARPVHDEGGKGDARPKAEAQSNDPPQTRMNKCGWNLTLKLGRPATATEVLNEYHRQQLHTGADDDGNRAKLAADSAQWCAQNFNPTKRKAFNPADSIQLIQEHVTPEIRAAIRKTNRSTYTDEQLAVVLHCIEISSTTRHKRGDLQFTVPNNSIISMFTKLEIELAEANADPKQKLRAMKDALVLSGLAEVVNANWTVGRGKKFGLGKHHPRHAEYMQFKSIISVETHV
jgi:hypothetical protein